MATTYLRWTDPRPGNPYGPVMRQQIRGGDGEAPFTFVEGPPVSLEIPRCPCGGSLDRDLRACTTVCTACDRTWGE